MPKPRRRVDPVRISTPADTVCAVPHLVGFHPTSSLVVICLHEPRGRIGLTMRYDLPPDAHDDEFASDVLARIEHDSASSVLVIVYPDVDGRPVVSGDLPRAQLVEEIERRCLLAGLRLKDALCVAAGRFWSYLCSDPACCPADGTTVPDRASGSVGRLAAIDAVRGRAVLADREALERSVAPVTFLARRTMGQALTVAAARAPLDAVDTIDLVGDLVLRYADPRAATMSEEEAARIIVALLDVGTRDAVLAEAAACADDDDEDGALSVLDEHLAVFLELARRALPPYDAPTLTVLAWIAYVRGNGALANVALERARRTNPTYYLAALLREALAGQVSPDDIRAAVRDPFPEMRDWGT